MLTDRPLDSDGDDHLGYGSYADALAELINHPETETPLTLAVSGPWGSGRTTLARMVERRLAADVSWPRPHVVVGFDASAHDHAPHLGAGLVAHVARRLARRRRAAGRLLRPLAGGMLLPRQRWRRLASAAGGALIVGAAIAFLPDPEAAWRILTDADRSLTDRLRETFEAAELVAGVAAVAAAGMLRLAFRAARPVARFVDNPRAEAARGGMEEVRQGFGALVGQALRGKRRLVVVVDGFDRCRPARLLELCETVSQVIAHPSVVVVLVGQAEAVVSAAGSAYTDLERRQPAEPTPDAYGERYLHRLVQVPFTLPTPRGVGLRDLTRAAVSTPPPPHAAPAQGSRRARRRRLARLDAAIDRVAERHLAETAPVVRSGGMAEDSPVRVALSGGRPDSPHYVDRVCQQLREAEPGLAADAYALRARVVRRLTDDALLRAEAEAELLRFVPPVPRSVTRVVNHLRLLLAIAAGQDVFGGSPPLQPRHLTKWAVLVERWPALGTVLTRHPDVVRDLEAALDLHQLQQVLTALELGVRGTPEMLVFFQSDLKFGPVLRRLVSFEPATASTFTAPRQPLPSPRHSSTRPR